LLDELETYFREQHPAHNDSLRVQVAEAIVRLRRELKRERAYFPTSVQALEQHIAEWEAHSLAPAGKEAVDHLTAILEKTEQVRACCARGGKDAKDQLPAAREAAADYLRDPRLWTPWLNHYLIDTLLSPPLLGHASRWPLPLLVTLRVPYRRRMAELIRQEISGGHYNAEEIARRLRRLDEAGLYISSLVYAILGAPAAPRAGARRPGAGVRGMATPRTAPPKDQPGRGM
jgi:hypothetical protein